MTPSPNPPVDAYELRVKLYSRGWDKSNFVSFTENLIKLCKLEQNKIQRHFAGVYIEVALTLEGLIKPGAAYYFLHGDALCPKLSTEPETHWLSPADDPAERGSIDGYYADYDGFPWGKEVLVQSYSSSEADYVYQTKRPIAKINGYSYRVSTLLEAIAMASFITIPYKTLQDLERIAEFSPSDIFEKYCDFRTSLMIDR